MLNSISPCNWEILTFPLNKSDAAVVSSLQFPFGRENGMPDDFEYSVHMKQSVVNKQLSLEQMLC